MEILESWIDALAMLTEPFWLTLKALGDMIVAAGAGTTLVALFLLVLSLDFLRRSDGVLVPISRIAAGVAALFLLSSLVFGDFMAAPARAAFSVLIARAPSVPSNTVALTTLSAAGAGIIYYAGRTNAPARPAAKRAASAPSKVHAMAERLQMRTLSRNPKRSIAAVRPSLRAVPATTAQLSRTGRRFMRA